MYSCFLLKGALLERTSPLDRVLRRLLKIEWSLRTSYGFATVAVIMTTIVRWAVPGIGVPYLLYCPTLMAVGFMCGYGPGFYATLLSAPLATHLFGTPTFGFGLSARWTGAFFYMLVGGGIVAICVALRQALMRREAALEAFRQTAKRLARSEDCLRESAKSLEQQIEERTSALRSSEARLRTIFETSYQYQGLMTTDGILLEANAVSLQGIGSKIEDVAGRPFWETPWFSGTPGMPEAVRSAITAVASGETVRQEISVNLPVGGWRSFDFTMRPIRDNKDMVIAIVPEAVEMTERRKAEEALRRSQKMEAVGQLTGGVAHDFNNLLTAVMGNLELLRKRLPDDPRAQRLLEGAMQGAERGSALTQRMLAFARQQDLKTSSADVASLLVGMGDLLERTLGPRIALSLQTPAGLPPAQVDTNQLELAILNLAINARDAMPDGGTLSISIDKEQVGAEKNLLEGSDLRVQVSDTGLGMDAATLKKAVEPFFSTKPLGKGTGLGLSMVHGLAIQLGGLLELSSEVGKGTTATLWLPIATNSPADKEPAVLQVTPSCPATILVVDDDPLIAMSAVDMLEDLGHTVIEANSPQRALEILEAGQAVDLMVTDQAMPGMTGVELAEIVRRKRPNMPILLVTGYADLPTARTNLPRLSKPYLQAQLQAEIDRLLETPN